MRTLKVLIVVTVCSLAAVIGFMMGNGIIVFGNGQSLPNSGLGTQGDPTFAGDTHWNVLGVVVRNIDVEIGGNRAQISMNSRDVSVARARFYDLERTLNTMPNGRMSATVSTIVINTPLRAMTAIRTTMGTRGYAASPRQISYLVAQYVNVSQFDHIMMFVRSQAQDAPFSVPTNWAGLYQGQLYGVHFSQVLFSQNLYCTWHTNAVFPERILVHEFAHGLEHIGRSNGDPLPSSIDAPRSNYGYGNTQAERFRFYSDFFNGNIRTPDGRTLGLSPESFMRIR